MPTNPLACSVELREGVPETSISIIPFLKSDWLIFTNLIYVFAPLSVTFKDFFPAYVSVAIKTLTAVNWFVSNNKTVSFFNCANTEFAKKRSMENK